MPLVIRRSCLSSLVPRWVTHGWLNFGGRLKVDDMTKKCSSRAVSSTLCGVAELCPFPNYSWFLRSIWLGLIVLLGFDFTNWVPPSYLIIFKTITQRLWLFPEKHVKKWIRWQVSGALQSRASEEPVELTGPWASVGALNLDPPFSAGWGVPGCHGREPRFPHFHTHFWPPFWLSCCRFQANSQVYSAWDSVFPSCVVLKLSV